MIEAGFVDMSLVTSSEQCYKRVRAARGSEHGGESRAGCAGPGAAGSLRAR